MKQLIKIRVVQFFLYESEEVTVGKICGVFGSNGSGKSTLLDAVQIVMLGANQSRGTAGVSFNAQADEGGHNTRSIRSYCLGQYGDANDARVRDNATTYITLVWHDTETQEIVSTGVCIAASSDKDKHEVLGRYVIPVDLSLSDHIETDGTRERPRTWTDFRQMLAQRSYGEEVLFNDSDNFLRAMLFRLRGSRGAPRLDAFRQAFRFGLRMKFDKSVDDIVRQQVLEARPTNIKRFKDVLTTFQEMSTLVRRVEQQLAEADLIEADFADANRRNSHAVSLVSLAHDAELEAANESVVEAEADEGKAMERLAAADDQRKRAAAAVAQAEEQALARAAERDKHASHADAAILNEQLAATRTRLNDQKTTLFRSVRAIARAIEFQIPGKLIAKSAETATMASRELDDLMSGAKQCTRNALETGIRRALRAAKAVSDELLADMQGISQQQKLVNDDLVGMRENLSRALEGKRKLDGPALLLKREFADAGIDSTPVCDLLKIDDPDWQPMIEAFLGAANMQALLVDEHVERKAFGVMRNAKIFEAKVALPSKFKNRSSPKRGSVAELITGTNSAAVNYLRSKFGNFMRTDTEEECLAEPYAMTKDGMLQSDGDLVRKQLISPHAFRIGPASPSTKTSLIEEIARLEKLLADLTETYGKLKTLFTSLGPFAGGETEKTHDLLEMFDRMNIEVDAERCQIARLQDLDTEEYRQLIQSVKDAEAAVTRFRNDVISAASAYGAAETACAQKKEVTKQRKAWAVAQESIAQSARANEGYDPDYASEQWDKLLDRKSMSFKEIAIECRSRSKNAEEDSRRKANSGLAKLGGYLTKHNEFLPVDAQGDWRMSRAWLIARTKLLRETGLKECRAKMDDALSTAKSTFRNDVAVALNENLEWLGDTVDRMNEALRAAPTFTNGERYQFRRQTRPAYAALLKFIKDVAQFGPTDDMFGGAGDIPPEFEELMREKTVVGSAAVKSPLDDYREFFEFDVEVYREDLVSGTTKHVGWLSKRVGSGSGGEHRAPLYVIAGAAISSAYRLERGDPSGMRLLVIDEAFIKMDLRNIVATMRYFEELGLQVFMASTGDALGTLNAFLDRYYDIMRDADSNIVLLEGRDVPQATRDAFRADLPEFNPALLEMEIANQFRPLSGKGAESATAARPDSSRTAP